MPSVSWCWGSAGPSQEHPAWHRPHSPLSSRGRVRVSPAEARGLGPARSLLLLADSLGLGACWPSRSRAHWGRKGGPAAKQEQLPEFPRKGGNMPADSNFLTVTPPVQAPQANRVSSEAGWASIHASGTREPILLLPGPPGCSSQCPALGCFLYFIPWPRRRRHHHTTFQPYPQVSGCLICLGSGVCCLATPSTFLSKLCPRITFCA